MKFRNIVGLGMLAGGGYAAYKANEKMKDMKAAYEQVIAFNGDTKVYTEFDGASIGVMFGGLNIDMTDAVMVGESATLTLKGEFSGIRVIVPRKWNVKVDGTYDKSGVNVGTTFNQEDTEAPLLIIRYDMAYSGLDIEYAQVEVVEIDEEVESPDVESPVEETTEEVLSEEIQEEV